MRLAFIIIILTMGKSYGDTKEIAPKVDVTLVRFNGDFDREAIRRSISIHKSKLELCKSSQPSLDFGVEFRIDLKGKARAIVNHGFPQPSDRAVDCVNKVFNEMQFPVPATDSTDWVMLPLRYEALAVENPQTVRQTTEAPQSEADKKNQQYLNRVKANALREMNEQNGKQNLILKAKLACMDQYKKDNLLENRDRCLAAANYGGTTAASAIPASVKACHKTCESQRMNLEVGCQRCSGGTVARQNCLSSCQRNIASQIDQCKSGCR